MRRPLALRKRIDQVFLPVRLRLSSSGLPNSDTNNLISPANQGEAN